jgi:nucleoid-associated protein YgaU
MISRYKNNGSTKTFDGRTVYRPFIYPDIPVSNYDLYVMSEAGDRLDSLANQYYKDPTLWWIIASANNIHTAPLGLREGTILRIPANYMDILQEFTL